MWDTHYSSEHYVFGLAPNNFLEEHFTAIPMGNVLCLAEGEGRNAVFLAEKGYSVTAVDSSSVGAEKAKRLADQNNVSIEYLVEDLETFDPGHEQWDGIVSIFCHLPETIRKEVHRKMVAGLKGSGVLLLEAYTPDQLRHGTGGPPREDLMISKADLLQELAGLHFSHLVELEREVSEGTLHTGIGSVVQAIATKKGA